MEPTSHTMEPDSLTMEPGLRRPEPPPRAAARLQALQQRFSFVIQTCRIGSRRLLLGTVSCCDQLLDELVSLDPDDLRRRDERLPYWAEVWPSAIALAGYVAEHPRRVANRRVLEIGCGQGLPAVMAGLCGAHVVLTDYDETALEFAALNWALNLASPPEVRRMDWREADVPPCDLLLAADVAYERRSFAPLLDFMRRTLASGGEAWIAEPQRALAEPFFQSLPALGFEVQTDVREVLQAGRTQRVDLHILRLS